LLLGRRGERAGGAGRKRAEEDLVHGLVSRRMGEDGSAAAPPC
jgi:hypothetical protein